VEILKIIRSLADPRAHGGDPTDAFHVVAPSIPGYGFSGPPRETGWDIKRVAQAFAKLVRRLGYSRYGAHGTDWGSRISRELARVDHDRSVQIAACDPYGVAVEVVVDDAQLATNDVWVERFMRAPASPEEAGVVVDALASHG
jgi:hypothetical protein